jgi:MFS family permease
MTTSTPISRSAFWLVTVAALGYFVDIYDLVLFNVVKKESLEHIAQFSGATFDITSTGIFLFNCQMAGMLIGGILWGIWGDKRGRVAVLFGSILLYSLANIVNAFVFDIDAYAIIRFIAGVGLAGELGAGITLISESLSRHNRGYGTMIVVTFGALGAVLAAWTGAKGAGIAQWLYDVSGLSLRNWQIVYLLGGFFGLLLLALRIGALESGMFKSLHQKEVRKGDFLAIFSKPDMRRKYLYCILIGLPVWFMIGVPVALSQEVFAPALDIVNVKNGQAVMYAYLGLSIGDLVSGLLSQLLRSRKKVVGIYLLLSLLLLVFFSSGYCRGITAEQYYILTFCIGFAGGYWAIFVSIAAEQFGTNIRSTVANTVPNFVRGAVLPITMLFTSLGTFFGSLQGAWWTGLLCLLLAAWAIYRSEETFAKDLDYLETLS